MVTLRRIKEFISKYWKLLLSALVVVGLVIRHELATKEQQHVLKNEITSNKKIMKIEREFDVKIREAEKAATVAHDAREVDIKKKEVKDLKKAKEDAVARERENSKLTGDELAKRFANTFGADVVEVEDNE